MVSRQPKVDDIRCQDQSNVSVINDSSLAIGKLDTPTLSIFVWQDGAGFDRTMNNYMSTEFPAGIDPSNPLVVQIRPLFLANASTKGGMFSGNASMLLYCSLLAVL